MATEYFKSINIQKNQIIYYTYEAINYRHMIIITANIQP